AIRTGEDDLPRRIPGRERTGVAREEKSRADEEGDSPPVQDQSGEDADRHGLSPIARRDREGDRHHARDRDGENEASLDEERPHAQTSWVQRGCPDVGREARGPGSIAVRVAMGWACHPLRPWATPHAGDRLPITKTGYGTLSA